MDTARKDSWKIEPMPPETAVLGYSEEFTPEEFEKISRGLIPKDMDDKWFIFLEGNTLHLHRSWTGFCIYQVEFAEINGKYVVRRALVNRNQSQYKSTDDVYASAMLHFLINRALLGRQVEVPLHEGTDKGPLQEHKPWWKFW